MRNKIKEKRKKLITKTYMNEAIEYQTIIIKENDEFYVTIKKYDKVSAPFSLYGDVKYIDNGTYIVELTPLKENYNVRFYVTRDKKVIDFYVDITLENGVQDKVPYYIDLYLDIINFPQENRVGFIDEDELIEALNEKKISKKDYDLAYKVGNTLLEEIQSGKNKYFNMDIVKFINRYFN